MSQIHVKKLINNIEAFLHIKNMEGEWNNKLSFLSMDTAIQVQILDKVFHFCANALEKSIISIVFPLDYK